MKLASLEKFRMGFKKIGFEKVFIIGFGQMGRSIANTLRVNHFSGKIFASSRSKIENCDYFDEEFDYNNANYNNSIVFICTPPSIINEMVSKIVEITKKNKNCIIADVCSVKKNVVKINCKNFISIHPMDSGNSDKHIKMYFKKRVLNYIIINNLLKIDADLLKQYDNFLYDFLNFENVKIDAKTHDKIVAITSHLQNLILASYYNDFSKIDNQMWREIFIQNQENIQHFLEIFLEKIKQKIDNNLLEDAIILALKDIMQTEKIKIKKELFNPSLRTVFELKNNNSNEIKIIIDNQKFVENMQNFFKNVVSKNCEL